MTVTVTVNEATARQMFPGERMLAGEMMPTLPSVRWLVVGSRVWCPACGGSGADRSSQLVHSTCQDCSGTGLPLVSVVSTDCIETDKTRNHSGYGVVSAGSRTDGTRRMEKHHRVVYAEANGLTLADIKEKVVMHTCDNPPCVNPKHLRLGTLADNMDDMVAKGRHASRSGTSHYEAKFTEEQLAAVRLDPRPQRTIAAEYGVSQSAISDIKTGKRYSQAAPSMQSAGRTTHGVITIGTAVPIVVIPSSFDPERMLAAVETQGQPFISVMQASDLIAFVENDNAVPITDQFGSQEVTPGRWAHPIL